MAGPGLEPGTSCCEAEPAEQQLATSGTKYLQMEHGPLCRAHRTPHPAGSAAGTFGPLLRHAGRTLSRVHLLTDRNAPEHHGRLAVAYLIAGTASPRSPTNAASGRTPKPREL